MTDDAITTVLLDLDGTLCEYRRSSGEVLTEAFSRVGDEPLFSVDAYHEIAERYIDDAAEKAQRRALCFADLAEENGYDPSVGRNVATVYATLRDHGNVRFLPGTATALDRLAETYRLGLVTNGEPAMQNPKLDTLGAADLFEVIVYAGYDTPAKPDPKPFDAALDALGATPAETVHVGNSLESDVAGANAAGLTSVWIPYDSPSVSKRDAATPDYRVASVRDVGSELWE